MRVLFSGLRRTVGAAALGASLCAAVVPLAAQPPDPAVLQQHAKEGERALAEGRYADAQKAYETLRQLSPGTAEVHARLGLIYFQQGKFAEAIPRLREAIKLKPGLPNIDALLAMSLSELGQHDEALPALTKAFSQSSDPVLRRMAGLHLLRAYTGLERDLDAVEVALQLSKLHPDDPEVLYHTGRLFANFAYLQTMRLAAVAPGSVWLHQAAGEANESQGLYAAAVQEYQQVIALAPRRPGIHFRLGRALLGRSEGGTRSADVGEARQAFEEELRIDPTNANAAYELAEMARKAGDLSRAREFFELAVKHYPEFEDALVGLGRTLIALGEPAQALPRLEAAVKHDPENEIAYYQLASAYRALARPEDQKRALAEFTRLRKLSASRNPAVPQVMREVTPQEIDDKPPR
ncbi:MAG TPA: tetratricopeptide repeat protein [Vicinamibacterales bacterium]|nr:tetratricopeptide repeat protein [Vicinamibacterales bacterium]